MHSAPPLPLRPVLPAQKRVWIACGFQLGSKACESNAYQSLTCAHAHTAAQGVDEGVLKMLVQGVVPLQMRTLTQAVSGAQSLTVAASGTGCGRRAVA